MNKSAKKKKKYEDTENKTHPKKGAVFHEPL